MVRRGSKFSPEDPPTMFEFANNNDTTSDAGSDIMTVSDVHTISNEQEISMMHQQQVPHPQTPLLLHLPSPPNHGDVAAGGIGNLYGADEIHTVDSNDNASIISDLQHTVGTGGGADDIHTVTGTTAGSFMAAPPMKTMEDLAIRDDIAIIGFDPNGNNDVKKSTTTTTPAATTIHGFWSRTLRSLGIASAIPLTQQRTADLERDEYYDEGRPIHPIDSPATGSNAPAMADTMSTPPPAVIVTNSMYDSPRRSGTNGVDSTAFEGDSTSDPFRTTSVWKQRLCGLRADRLILLLVLILFVAISVIVGAVIVLQQESSNGTTSASSNVAENNIPRDENFVNLTRTPTIFRVPVSAPSSQPPTMFPTTLCDDNITALDDLKVVFPVEDSDTNDIEYRNCTWVSSRPLQQEQLCQPDQIAYELCRFTCKNCEELPRNTKKAWPEDLCGGDSNIESFFAGENFGMGNCNWLSKSPFDIDRLCQPGNDAYDLCRKTCRNCGPTVIDTIVPSNMPSGPPLNSNTTISDAPSISPSASPVPTSRPTAVPLASPAPITTTSAPVVATLEPATSTDAPPVVDDLYVCAGLFEYVTV
jgi:hypothetical protein